jgi:hypothetical protein
MNKKELKSLIKEMVRESLTEIFVEMKLENIVENVVRQKVTTPASHEYFEESIPRKQQTPKRVMKEEIKSKLGISDNEWRNIYEDVNTEKMPAGTSSQFENPEFTTEDDLRKLGLL